MKVAADWLFDTGADSWMFGKSESAGNCFGFESADVGSCEGSSCYLRAEDEGQVWVRSSCFFGVFFCGGVWVKLKVRVNLSWNVWVNLKNWESIEEMSTIWENSKENCLVKTLLGLNVRGSVRKIVCCGLCASQYWPVGSKLLGVILISTISNKVCW